jgi:bifunctional pyridoxal-dependent enzyme with beta-cystathionase and maltose regulon repressor activities
MNPKLAELKERAAKLDQAIADKDARDHLLRIPKSWLADVEGEVAHDVEVMLPLIEQLLDQVEVTVAKYGPFLRIVG